MGGRMFSFGNLLSYSNQSNQRFVFICCLLKCKNFFFKKHIDLSSLNCCALHFFSRFTAFFVMLLKSQNTPRMSNWKACSRGLPGSSMTSTRDPDMVPMMHLSTQSRKNSSLALLFPHITAAGPSTQVESLTFSNTTSMQ